MAFRFEPGTLSGRDDLEGIAELPGAEQGADGSFKRIEFVAMDFSLELKLSQID